MNRLEGYGVENQLPDLYKRVAFRKLLVGKIRDHFDLWDTEKHTYDTILKKVKEQARNKKLDGDAARGKSGISMGAQQPQGGGGGANPQEKDHEEAQTQIDTISADAFQKKWNGKSRRGDKGKGKGKGKGGDGDGKGKGKCGQHSLNAASPGPQVVGSQSFSGCFICGSKQHYGRECPKNPGPNV